MRSNMIALICLRQCENIYLKTHLLLLPAQEVLNLEPHPRRSRHWFHDTWRMESIFLQPGKSVLLVRGFSTVNQKPKHSLNIKKTLNIFLQLIRENVKTPFSCQPSLQQPSFFGQLYTKVRQWSSGKHASGQKRHERCRQKIQTKSGWHWTIQHFTSSLFNKTLTLIQTNENSPNDHPDAAAACLCGQKRHAKYARSVHIEKCVRGVVAATTHGF